jgi:hypothetical protein
MLMIKDLSATKELDRKAMSAVHGGLNINAGNLNNAVGGGFASPAVVVAPVSQTDAPVTFDLATIQNFGGVQLARA